MVFDLTVYSRDGRNMLLTSHRLLPDANDLCSG
jgi:hypothetical protein